MSTRIYTHAPQDYICPFCAVVAGHDNPYPYTTRSDVVWRDEHTVAFINAHWWPNNAGHTLVIPTRHVENLYTLTPDLAAHLHETTRQVALAMKEAYGCDGISTRQHNEPGGDQEVWHYHLHVFPRYHGDRLYQLTEAHRLTTPEERAPYAARLRAALSAKEGDDAH